LHFVTHSETPNHAFALIREERILPIYFYSLSK
jgi:hypothetical protein